MTTMVSAVATLKSLENAGFSRQQAEALVDVVSARDDAVATKGDLKATEDKLRVELKGTEDRLRGEIKTEIAGVRTEVKAETNKLLVAIAVAAIGLYVTTLKQPAPPPPQAMQVPGPAGK